MDSKEELSLSTVKKEQNNNLSATIAQLGVDAEKFHQQMVILDEIVNQLQEQQKQVLAATDRISNSGEKLSKEIELISTVILERKQALDSISEIIVSVVKESLLVTNEVAQTAVELNKESETTKEQDKKCDSLDADIDSSSVMQTLTSLKESIDRCKKEQDDDEKIILNAQRALDASKASRQRSNPADTPSEPSVGS